MKRLHYFAYGSNMSSPRLLARVPSARRVGVAHLDGYRLEFHKRARGCGTAKCDLHRGGDGADRVYGVVFSIDPADKPALDRCEDLGQGYGEREVDVVLGDGRTVCAFTYYALLIDPACRPLDWYREHVLRGARENRLPADYIRRIEAITCEADEDAARRERELSIYRR